MLPLDPLARHGRDVAFDWYRTQRIEPPASDELDKTIRSAVRHYETLLQADIYNRLSIDSKVAINHLLSTEDTDETKKTSGSNLSKLKMDPGKPSLENVLTVIYQLKLLDKVALKPEIFERIPAKFIEIFQQRCATESFAAFKKVRGKARLLFRMAEATVDQPDGVIKEVVYPVVSQKMLQNLVDEFKTLGVDTEQEVHESMRSSYGSHYRRMLMPVLDRLEFQSGNALHRPVIDAIQIIKANRASNQHFYAVGDVPVDGIIQKKWRNIVVVSNKLGEERINRINYEICVLRALRKSLRNKEIWVDGADRYRDPAEDLPVDFAVNREKYYSMLQVPADAKIFIDHIKGTMRQWLSTLNNGLPKNAKLRLREQGKNRIHLTPLDRQIEPPNTTALKREIGQRWDDLELIDIIKEVDLRENFSAVFRTSASREVLEPEILQRRLLLCLFGLGTNVGLKRVASNPVSVMTNCVTSNGVSLKKTLYVVRFHTLLMEFSISANPLSGGMPLHPVPQIPGNSAPMTKI